MDTSGPLKFGDKSINISRECRMNVCICKVCDSGSYQAVPYHYESSDGQGVVCRVSDQRPAGEMDRLRKRERGLQTDCTMSQHFIEMEIWTIALMYFLGVTKSDFLSQNSDFIFNKIIHFWSDLEQNAHSSHPCVWVQYSNCRKNTIC